MADSDLVSLAQGQESIRHAAAAYGGSGENPGLAVALAQSGASAAQVRAISGFADALDLTTKVVLARQSGVQLDFTNDQRATLASVGTRFDDVDKQQLAAQTQQSQSHGGFFGTLSRWANDVSKLPGVGAVFHGLDRASDVLHGFGRIGSEGGLLNASGIDLGPLNHPLIPGAASAKSADVQENLQGMQAQGYKPGNVLSTLAFYSRGNQVFHAMDDLRQQYSPDMVNLAQQYLEDPEAFTGGNLSDDDLLKRQKLLQDQRFQGLVQQVDARHISPGRDLAGAVGLKPGQKIQNIGGVAGKDLDLFKIVSGGLDAAYSFAADPTIILGKGVAATRAARYGIADLSDTNRVRGLMEENSAVKRGWMQLLDAAKAMRVAGTDGASTEAKAAAAQAYARVNASTPELVPMLDEINGGGLRAGRPIDTYEDLVDHVTGHTALLRMRNGLAAAETPLMPGAVPRAGYRALKGALAGKLPVIDLEKRASDFIATAGDAVNSEGADITGLDQKVLGAADSEAVGKAALAYRRTLKGRAATLAQRVTTLLPEHNTLDLTGGSGVEDLRRFAATYMPRSHANLLASRYAVASVGERRAIAEAVYDQTLHAAGIPASTSGAAWMEYQKTRRSVLDNSAFDSSGKGNDIIRGAPGEAERREALYDGQTSTDFYLPNVAEMRRFAAKVSIYDYTAKKALESQAMDTALGALRTSWLVSPASAVRNGIENLLSAQFRGASADELARSRAALSSVLAKRVADRASELAQREVDPQFHKMSGSLRGVYQGRILTGIKRAEHVIGRDVANDDLIKRAQELIDDEMSGDLHELTALTGLSTRGDARNVDDFVSSLDKGFKLKAVGFKNVGYQLDSADGMGGARYWGQQLGARFKGTEGVHVLKAAVEDTPEARQALIEHLLSPEYADARARLERFSTLRDGTKVGTDDVTDPLMRRAAEELAADQVDDMRALVTGRNNELVQPLIDELMRTGKVPNIKFLSEIKDELRPEQVIQPKFVPDLEGVGIGGVASNVVQALGDAGYNLAVARPLAWMSSLPIYHANYVKAYDRVLQVMKSSHPGWAEEDLAPHVRDVARQHAMDLTVQMIDNPRVRSQMALITRNVFNFWRAQEDFMRRWGRNLHENPAALREIQLAVEGGMHTGLVHKDDQGQLVFSYPGSGLAIQGLGKALSVFGLSQFQGIGVVPNMTTKMQFLNAGLDRPFLPSTSPVASLPLRILQHFNQDQVKLIQAREITEGTIGASRSWWSQFIPSPVARFMAAQSSDDREGQYASAVRNAMLNLYAAGQAPGPDASPDEQDRFKRRVQVGVRNHLTARALLALILPGAPSNPTEETDASKNTSLEAAAFNTTSLKQEFSQWVNEYGYQRALALWTKAHPDDLVYTVGTTEGAGGTGGHLGPTDEVLKWIKSNPALVTQFPQLAAYFAPQGPGDFSQDAWQTELELGLRRHKDLDTFYKDIAVKNAETKYYQYRDWRDQAVAEALGRGDNDQADQIKQGFSTWVDSFKATNPLLLEKWNDTDQSKQRIAELVKEAGELAASPLAKQVDPHGDLATIVQYYNWKKQYDDTHDATTAEAKAEQDSFNTGYLQAQAKLLARSPQLIPLYQGIFGRLE